MRDTLTREALEARARADYEAHVGKLLRVGFVTGYWDGNADDVFLDPPAIFRVMPGRPENLKNWVDGWLDPSWDLLLVEPHPQLTGWSSFWIYGISYSLNGEVTTAQKWEPITTEALCTQPSTT